MQQVFDLETVNDVLLKLAAEGKRELVRSRDAAGNWQPLTAEDFVARVEALAHTFAGWGIGKGDRVALLAENRWEWAATDFATLALGAVDVPLYPTLPADQIGYMLRDSGAKVAVVSSREQYDKVMAGTDLPALEHIVVMDEGEFANAELFRPLVDAGKLTEADREKFEQTLRSIQPDDLATIIYTSGTTGEPKGVMLSHGNLASNLNCSTAGFRFSKDDVWISFLPLSHVTARHLDYALLSYGARLAYCPTFDELPEAFPLA